MYCVTNWICGFVILFTFNAAVEVSFRRWKRFIVEIELNFSAHLLKRTDSIFFCNI